MSETRRPGVFGGMLKALGLKKSDEPAAEEFGGDKEEDPFLLEAVEALKRGDSLTARRVFVDALKRNPDNIPAELGLARLDLAGGDREAGLVRLDRGVTRAFARKLDSLVWTTLDEFRGLFTPDQLRPQTTFRIAQGLETAPAPFKNMAQQYYEVAAAAGGVIGDKAQSRLAELRSPSPAPKMAAPGKASGFQPMDNFRIPAPKISACRLRGLPEGAIEVERSDGSVQVIPLDEVDCVLTAMVQGQGGRSTLMTDLVHVWGDGNRGAQVTRIPSTSLGLSNLFPGAPNAEAYQSLIRHLTANGQKRVVQPGQKAEGAKPPPFRSEKELDESAYRQG